jgi:hypothetical protein
MGYGERSSFYNEDLPPQQPVAKTLKLIKVRNPRRRVVVAVGIICIENYVINSYFVELSER